MCKASHECEITKKFAEVIAEPPLPEHATQLDRQPGKAMQIDSNKEDDLTAAFGFSDDLCRPETLSRGETVRFANEQTSTMKIGLIAM